jgi:hypothetical protein
MKTHYGHYAELWQRELLALNKTLDPVASRKRPKYISHTARPHPISKQSPFTDRDLPRLVPTYNPQARVDIQQGAIMRALLFAMKADFDSSFLNITSDDLLVVLDSGCSIAITPDRNDFINGTYHTQEHNISGIGSGLNSAGIGDVNWKFIDVKGQPVTIRLTCLHVPAIPCRLLPPQQVASQGTSKFPEGAWIGRGKSAKVISDGHVIDFPYDPNSNLPSCKMAPGTDRYCSFIAKAMDSTAAVPTPTPSKQDPSQPTAALGNLTSNQKTLLRVHHRMAHRSFADIQTWAREGRFKLPIELSQCTIPVCLSCSFSTATKRPHAGATDSLGHESPEPGDFVSVDTMEAGIPGRMAFTNGRPSHRRYTNSTVWVDQSSKHLWVDHQETKTAKETLISKIKYEQFAARFGRSIKHIHSDNGIFAKSVFVASCDAAHQRHTFCGVGAHWQNGSVERYIGVLTSKARTMLLHSMRMWPGLITAEFWPFAVSQAGQIHNHSPRRGASKTPHELFTDEASSIHPNDFRVFGCPVFVLVKELQDGKSIPKFSRARSYMGVYVGQSKNHASNVALVYNPRTQLVSPQYHLIYDEGFETVASADPVEIEKNITAMFDNLFDDNEWIHNDDYIDPASEQTHRYFDFSWDISRIYEDLHARKRQLKKQLARAIQKNALLRKQLGIPKFLAGGIPDTATTVSEGVASSRHQEISLGDPPTLTPFQASEGVTARKTWIRSHVRTNKHKRTHESISTSEGVAKRTTPVSALSRDASPSVSTVGPSDDPYLRPPNEVPPVPPPDPATPLTTSPDIPDLPAGDFLHIISQLCSTHASNSPIGSTNDTSATPSSLTEHPLLATLTSLLSTISEKDPVPQVFDDTTSSDEEFQAICDILDHRNILDDGIDIEGYYDVSDPFAFAAGTQNNPDILSRSRMLKSDDSADFLKTENDEIAGLHDAGVFQYLPVGDIPYDRRKKLLNAIWSYRRKRRPDGTLVKHKCRICADGSQQRYGIDYWDTYSPVVQWSTVRLIMILAAVLGLSSRQVDYTQAFPQAPLDDDVYMRIPDGWAYDHTTESLVQITDTPTFRDSGYCIKLQRNLYGCKQASRNWYIHLTNGLKRRGFQPSTIDPCLYIKDDCLICLYTDDCCIFAHDDAIIDKLIQDLRDDSFLLKDEGDIEDFLGIHIERTVDDDGGIEISMTQTGLIDSIIEDLGLNTTETKHDKHDTPANEILQPDLDQPAFAETWIYRSVIGKLNFLAMNTRPDIAYAVHQCARFCANPRVAHGTAVKRIGRYLKTTRTKGLILRPDGENNLHAYCDSDFCGTWTPKTAHERGSALSRTGYVITYSNCPIFWASKLQTEIALSTCEAEYIALSMCCRQLIPMRYLLEELSKLFKVPSLDSPLCSDESRCMTGLGSSIILEDNAAALALANDGEKYRPRTKHLSIKWHHFRDQVVKGWLQVHKVDTKENWADIFTKPLPRPQFILLRDELMGWQRPRKRTIHPNFIPPNAAAALAYNQHPRKRRRRR